MMIRAGVSAVDRRGVRAVVAVGSAGGAGAGRLHGPPHQGEEILSPAALGANSTSSGASSSTGLVIMEAHVHLSVTTPPSPTPNYPWSVHPNLEAPGIPSHSTVPFSIFPQGKSRDTRGARCSARLRPALSFRHVA